LKESAADDDSVPLRMSEAMNDPRAADAGTAYAGGVSTAGGATTSNETAAETPPGAGTSPGGGVFSPFVLLFAPDRGMEHQARVGRARWFFLFAWLCSILLGAALAYRVDARSSTLRKLEMSGQLQTMSDRQIADETRNAERVSQVLSVAKGVTAAPVQLGLTCLSVLLLCWFFRGRIKGRAVVPVAAASLLPGAIASLIDAAAAFRHTAIPPGGTALGPRTLTAVMGLAGRPLFPPWIKFGNALDFFSLWAAVMLAFGVAAAGQVPKRTAVVGTLTAWVCYRLLTNVAAGG
jgi:hypothetical protein